MNYLHPYRIKRYSEVSTALACIKNEELNQFLASGKTLHEGIGGKSVLLSIQETPVFVKRIPLTEFEQLPQNFMSTANIFGLPLFYQYGVGSAGFGAWRELAAHIMTTNWVMTGECLNFPILYHFRILPSSSEDLNYWEDFSYWGGMEKYCQYWENSSAIRKRVTALNKAEAHIALFLEYIPQNLNEWLSAQIIKESNIAESAVAWVDEQLKMTNTHMNRHGLLHFDVHFRNILTDGKLLYFSDFGLALSSQFELTAAEREFLNYHRTYDAACAATNLLQTIMTALFGEEQWPACLHEFIAGKCKTLLPVMATIIKRYASISLMMDGFFQKLQKESKLTPFPVAQLECLEKIAIA